MRTFTSDGVKFQGFNKDFSTMHDLVLVFIDGEPDIWAIDNSKGFENLIKYLKIEPGGTVKIFGRYSFHGFKEVTCPNEMVDERYFELVFRTGEQK